MRKLWRVMRRVLKWSGITVFGLLALALLLFAAAFIINAHDEQLSPQARALLTPPPNPYKPEDNIFLALLGADAPPGESIIAAGSYEGQQLQPARRCVDAQSGPGCVGGLSPAARESAAARVQGRLRLREATAGVTLADDSAPPRTG
jgi:hypothetical protein